MIRFALSALVALVLVTPVSAQTPAVYPLSSLGIGHIYFLLPVELDGQPGSEFLAQVGHPFDPTWAVLYPHHAGGMCNAGTISFVREDRDSIIDVDGDGKDEMLRFDHDRQTVAVVRFPTCR